MVILELLPEDILFQVLARVDCINLFRNCALVCKKWYSIITSGDAFGHLQAYFDRNHKWFAVCHSKKMNIAVYDNLINSFSFKSLQYHEEGMKNWQYHEEGGGERYNNNGYMQKSSSYNNVIRTRLVFKGSRQVPFKEASSNQACGISTVPGKILAAANSLVLWQPENGTGRCMLMVTNLLTKRSKNLPPTKLPLERLAILGFEYIEKSHVYWIVLCSEVSMKGQRSLPLMTQVFNSKKGKWKLAKSDGDMYAKRLADDSSAKFTCCTWLHDQMSFLCLVDGLIYRFDVQKRAWGVMLTEGNDVDLTIQPLMLPFRLCDVICLWQRDGKLVLCVIGRGFSAPGLDLWHLCWREVDGDTFSSWEHAGHLPLRVEFPSKGLFGVNDCFEGNNLLACDHDLLIADYHHKYKTVHYYYYDTAKHTSRGPIDLGISIAKILSGVFVPTNMVLKPSPFTNP